MFVNDMPWSGKGACVGADPEIFFPEIYSRKNVAEAIDICDTCPVRQECLAHAEGYHETGIWGGKFFRVTVTAAAKKKSKIDRARDILRANPSITNVELADVLGARIHYISGIGKRLRTELGIV